VFIAHKLGPRRAGWPLSARLCSLHTKSLPNRAFSRGYTERELSWPFLVLLALALVLLVGAEWPRLASGRGLGRLGAEGRDARARQKRKANLKLVRTESDDFAASVERDLAELPTIEEKDRRR
jgi:hypothetical protein